MMETLYLAGGKREADLPQRVLAQRQAEGIRLRRLPGIASAHWMISVESLITVPTSQISDGTSGLNLWN
jgi:hypothetical protein